MEISCKDFKNNSLIPLRYTCDGSDINPRFEIKDIPKSSKSLALIVDDPDARIGIFLHWILCNIDTDIESIEENSIPPGAIQGRNDFGKENYGGPCPSSGKHRYFFKLYALDVKLNLSSGFNKEDLLKAMDGHILENAEVIGWYERS